MLRLVPFLVLFGMNQSCTFFQDDAIYVEEGIEFLVTKEDAKKEYVYNCRVGREFVAIHNFLRDSKATEISGKEINRIASEVSKGCTGSAKRFIKVFSLLTKVKAGTKKAVELGMKYAQLSDGAADAYVEIFKHSYLKQYLDLNLSGSMKIAEELTQDVSSEVGETPEKSYRELVQFCLSDKGLGMARPACAKLSAEMTRAGLGFEVNVGQVYREAIEFLRDEEGPKLSTDDARRVTEELIKVSPYALENYKIVFAFASSPKGLSLERKKASELALKISSRTKSLVR